MDMAWALLEARMRREPTADPNQIWTELTSRYLHIVPHPEVSWWATRGQLIESPGYMMNYGAGAIVVAELRQRARASRGSFANGDPAWYAWLSERLYRFGRERPSERVILDFLGRPLSPDALLADLERTKGGTGSTTRGDR
jgi:Zn-dependent M32 family carboxypeptidase